MSRQFCYCCFSDEMSCFAGCFSRTVRLLSCCAAIFCYAAALRAAQSSKGWREQSRGEEQSAHSSSNESQSRQSLAAPPVLLFCKTTARVRAEKSSQLCARRCSVSL